MGDRLAASQLLVPSRFGTGAGRPIQGPACDHLASELGVAVGFEPTEGVNPHALSRSVIR